MWLRVCLEFLEYLEWSSLDNAIQCKLFVFVSKSPRLSGAL